MYALRVCGYICMQISSSWIISGRQVFTFLCTGFFQICSCFNLMNAISLFLFPWGKKTQHTHTHKVYYKLGHLITTYMNTILSFDFTFYIRNFRGFEDFVVELQHLCRDSGVIRRVVVSDLGINIKSCIVN